MPTTRSLELREEANKKHATVGEILKLAGDRRDFSKKEILDKLGATDSDDAVKKWSNLGAEAHGLFEQVAEAELEEDIKAHEDLDRDLKAPTKRARHPAQADREERTPGQLFVESKAYKDWRAQDGGNRSPSMGVMLDIGVEAFLGVQPGRKTLMTTSAGFAPDSPRTSDVVPFALRPVQFLQLIQVDTVNVVNVKWMEKTTFTVSAAEIAEAAAYPESVYVYTERSAPIQKIADSLQVTDEQLDDVDQMATLIDDDLRTGVNQKLDSQTIVGTGTPPQIRGILNYAGIQTQARAADPHFDAVFKAITKVRAVGRAEPNAIGVHSTDWQTFRLMRTADGIYIMGNPSDPGAQQLFGIPVVINEVLTVGTSLLGDFARYARLKQKKGVEVQVGYQGQNFVEGKKTVRADTRVAMVVRRAAAFCTVTGL